MTTGAQRGRLTRCHPAEAFAEVFPKALDTLERRR
jgi:hypothetical protein